MMDEAMFVEQVQSHERTLYRTAYSIMRNNQDSLDAVQSALTKAWAHRRKADPSVFRAWLLRIVINECYSMRRRLKRETLIEDFAQTADQPPPDPSLRDALDRLPENLKLSILLFYMEGFSVQEIAGMLKTPSSTIKWRLSKARKLLKEDLSEKGVALHGGF